MNSDACSCDSFAVPEQKLHLINYIEFHASKQQSGLLESKNIF